MPYPHAKSRLAWPLGLILLCACAPLAAHAAAQQPALLLGAAWYPEQWPESRWPEDLKLMEAAHIRMVRVAEFAWSRLEPRDSQFDLDWLDRAIALAAKHRIAVVIGTPSAAPPRLVDTEISGRAAHRAGWPEGETRQPAAGGHLAQSGERADHLHWRLARRQPDARRYTLDDRHQRVAAALRNVPEGVEVSRRAGAGKEVFVLVNHTKTPQRITLPAPMRRCWRTASRSLAWNCPAAEWKYCGSSGVGFYVTGISRIASQY